MAGTKRALKKKQRLFIAIGVAGLLMVAMLTIWKTIEHDKQIAFQEMQKLKRENVMLESQLSETLSRLDLFLQTTKDDKKTVKTDYTDIVVSTMDLPEGTILTEQHLKTDKSTKKRTSNHNFNFKNELIGRILKKRLTKGMAIEDSMLQDKDSKNIEVPDGYRAMTLPVNDISGVNGFIMPGSRVDLVTVVPDILNNTSRTDDNVSNILAQNVKVLDISTKSNFNNGKNTSNSTMTVAVPVSQVIKIALAHNNGKGNIIAVLRSYTDKSQTDKTILDSEELITRKAKIPEILTIPDIDLPKPPSMRENISKQNIDLNSILNNIDNLPVPEPPTAQTRTHSVEVIQANSRQEIAFETEI